MKFHINPGLEPYPVAMPGGELPVPTGFIEALLRASKFSGRSNKTFPWVQYVYLSEGKLYASDNRCIVEIDLGDPAFGPARFSLGDVSVMKAIGHNPHMAKFTSEGAAFTWEDGRWCSFNIQMVGTEMVDRSRALLQEFWHERRKVLPKMASAIKKIAKTKKAGEVARFKAAQIDQSEDQFWHCGAIAKVMEVATNYNPSATPTPFTFPNGKGLIVKPSGRRI